MGTLAQRFYPHSDDWDGTDPASGNVRAANISLPALNTTSSVDFGSSGAKTITVDPYTAGRTTQGPVSTFGWAVDIGGSDGMDSAADAKRIIPAGTWLFQGTLATAVAALANVVVEVRVYRVAAAPSTTRTLLTSTTAAGVLPLAAGTSWTSSLAGQPKFTIEAGETVQVSYALVGTGQVGGLVVTFHTGDPLATNDCLFDVPTPGIRTERFETHSMTGKGTPTRVLNVAPLASTVTGKGTTTIARSLVAAVARTVTGRGTTTRGALTIAKLATTVTGKGAVTGRIELPIDEVPEGGGGTIVKRPIMPIFD